MNMSTPDRLQLTTGVVHLPSRVLRHPDGRETRLTSQSAALLTFLVAHAGEPVSRDQLMDEVWRAKVSNSAIDVGIRRLRRAIERDPSAPRHILSAHGVGFVFQPLPTTPPPAEEQASAPAAGLQERVLARLRQSAGLVTVHGPGGSGKTRVARGVAAAWGSTTWTCGAAELESVGWVVSAVATLVGLGERSREAEEVGETLRQAGPALLVLDDVEHLVEPLATVLLGWMRQAPELRILATSRVRFRLRGERCVTVPPLSPERGAELFARQARRLGAQVDPADPAVRELVEQVGGLPLAVEIAAGWARSLPPAELLDALAHPRDLVDRDLDRSPRHRSLEEVVRSTCALLPPRARRGLALLALCSAPFDRSDAEALLAWSPTHTVVLLEQLLDHAILRTLDGKERLLAFHPGVRLVVLEELDPRLRDEAQARRLAHRAVRCRRGVSVAWVRRMLPDLLADIAWGAERGMGDAVELATAAARVGAPDELVPLLEALRAAVPLDSGPSGRLGRALATMHLRRGRRAEAMPLLDEALAIARTLGDEGEQGRVRVALGTVSRLLGHPQEAREHLEKALIHAGVVGDPALKADAHASLGAVQYELGDRTAAARSFASAAEGFQQVGDRGREASARLNVAMTHDGAGRLSAAEEGYRRAQELYEAVGEPRGAGAALLGRGRVQLIRSPEAALPLFEAALAIHVRGRDPLREAEALCHVAAAERTLGALPEARAHLERALVRAQRAGDRRLEAIVWVNLARTCLADGPGDAAARAGSAAEAIGREGRYVDVVATAQMVEAECLLQDDPDRARALLDTAAEDLRALEQQEELVRLECLRVLALVGSGRQEEARAALRSAQTAAWSLGAHERSELGAYRRRAEEALGAG